MNPFNTTSMQALTDSITPKFAVSYIRVSTPDQAKRSGTVEGFSIPAQREANKQKALSIGAIIGKEFIDRGTSAKTADRPELIKMLKYIEENKARIDYVIVHKVDRLARNRDDDSDITRVLKKANIQLVSVSESIDYTPSGMLVHGIMSTIAQFYSDNLSTEVKKGMLEKAKNGGTTTRAPLGYRNIRGYDNEGRRDSHVDVDAERAPLIELAFKEYATGNWSLNSLAEHLDELGLATPATYNMPSKPINKKMLHRIFNNPYYKGIVTYNDVQYPGKHEAIIDEKTWDKVQEILRSHVNGERTRVHEHYLKSTVYCGKCGARLIIHNAKSQSGDIYPYFVCSAKHNKRHNCKQRAVLIDEVADKIEQLYDRIAYKSSFKELLQNWLNSQIAELTKESEVEISRLKQQKNKLEREQRKLLQAHYSDAIPIDLLKEEQDRIGQTLCGINERISACQAEYTEIGNNMELAFELLDDCGKAYRQVDDSEKRCFNQAIFERICVHDDLTLDAQYNEPFDTLLGSEVLTMKSQFDRFLQDECDGNPQMISHRTLTDFLNYIITKTSSKIHNFFTAGLSFDFMVPVAGLEPARCCQRWILSPLRLPIPSHRQVQLRSQLYNTQKLISRGEYIFLLRFEYADI